MQSVDDMRYAVIENNVVVNVINAPEGWTIAGKTLVASDTAEQRDTWAPDGVVLEGEKVFFVPGEKLDPPVDLAICPMNTFRHLLTESDARSHLESIASGLRPAGIYLLGFHLLPTDIDPESSERWSARHGSTHVTFSLKVLDSNRRKRIETIRFRLNVTSGDPPQRRMRFEDEFPLRMYTAVQFRRLLKSVPAFELLDVYDFWYDIDEPLKLNNEITDTMFVLRKR